MELNNKKANLKWKRKQESLGIPLVYLHLLFELLAIFKVALEYLLQWYQLHHHHYHHHQLYHRCLVPYLMGQSLVYFFLYLHLLLFQYLQYYSLKFPHYLLLAGSQSLVHLELFIMQYSSFLATSYHQHLLSLYLLCFMLAKVKVLGLLVEASIYLGMKIQIIQASFSISSSLQIMWDPQR